MNLAPEVHIPVWKAIPAQPDCLGNNPGMAFALGLSDTTLSTSGALQQLEGESNTFNDRDGRPNKPSSVEADTRSHVAQIMKS